MTLLTLIGVILINKLQYGKENHWRQALPLGLSDRDPSVSPAGIRYQVTPPTQAVTVGRFQPLRVFPVCRQAGACALGESVFPLNQLTALFVEIGLMIERLIQPDQLREIGVIFDLQPCAQSGRQRCAKPRERFTSFMKGLGGGLQDTDKASIIRLPSAVQRSQFVT